MKQIFIFGLLIFWCIGVSQPLIGQDWQEVYDQALKAYNENELTETIRDAQKAVELAEVQFGVDSEPYSYSAQLLSVACYEAGQFNKGIESAQLQIESNRLRNVHDTIQAGAIRNLVVNCQGAGQLDSAIQLIRQLIPIYREHYGMESYKYNLNLSDLAYGLLAQGRTDTVLILLKQANGYLIDIPDGGEDYLNNLYQIAVLQYQKGSVDLALKDLVLLKEILEDNGLQNELIYGQVLDQFGAIHYGKEDLDRAEEFYTQAVVIYQQHYPDPVYYQPPLIDLAAIYLKKGDKARSDSILALLPKSAADSNILINQINLASSKYQEGSLKESLQYYQDILQSSEFQNLSDQSLKGDVLTNYASVNLDDRNYQEALRTIDHIIPFYRQTGNQTKLARALNIRARAHDHLGDYEKAKADHREAFELLPSVEAKSKYAIASDLMKFYYTRNQFQEAKEVYDLASTDPALRSQLQYDYALVTFSQGNLQAARDLLESLPDQNLKLKITLGVVNLELDDFKKAESSFKEVEAMLTQNREQNSTLYAENLINQGRLNLKLGNYPEAESFYMAGLAMLAQDDPGVSYANGLNAVAIFYQTLGNYDAALEYYIQAKSIYHKNSTELADLLQNMATLYQIHDQEEESILLLNEALEIYRTTYGEKHPYYGVASQNLASVYEKRGEFEKAEALYREALSINLTVYGQNHHSTANTMHNLAVLYQDNNRYAESLDLFESVIEIRRELLGEHHPDYVYSVYGLAVLHHKMGEISKAKPYFDQVVEEYLHQVQNYFPFLSEREKSAFYLKVKEVFQAYHDFAIEFSQEDPTILAQSFDLHMATKAILLSSSNTIRRSILASNDEDLIQKFNQWTLLKEDIIRSYGLSTEQLRDNGTDIKSLEEEANQLEKFLSLKSVAFTSSQTEQNPKWNEIQSALGDKQAVVEMLRIRKNIRNDSILYVAFIITPETQGNPDIVVMPHGKDMEDKWFRGYINTMRFQISNPFGYDHFWKPLASRLEGIETIYFSPDGIYNKININTLLDPANSEYLLDKAEIRYLTKASQLLQDPKPNQEEKTAGLYGFPNFGHNSLAKNVTRFNRIIELPGTKQELEQIHDLFGINNWESQIFLQENATEENLKASNSPQVLHIATHGFFLEDSKEKVENLYNIEDNPLLRCGLLMTGSQDAFKGNRILFNTKASGEDGILTAYEVMNLDLSGTEIVVLSACETALGEIENGEGVYGLQRAFITSGAETIVMSLWKVDDFATQELMVNFYQHFLNGDNKFEAFTKAQKMIRAKYAAPYFWGAFIINGI